MNDQPLKGALLLILGEGLLAVMAAMIKYLANHLDTEVIVFARNIFGLMFVLPLVISRGGLGQLRTRFLHLHLVRAFTGVSAMFCFFYAISHIALAEAVLVKMTAPFFLPLVAWLWLKETISMATWLAIAVGFLGVATIMQVGSGQVDPVMWFALAGAALMSVAKVSIRRMAVSEPIQRVVFYFALFATLFSCIPLFWSTTFPQGQDYIWLLAVGLVATGGQFAMTTAYQIAQPGQVGVYNYSSVVWAALLGWIFWGETLVLTTLLGTGLIISAGIWNLKKQ